MSYLFVTIHCVEFFILLIILAVIAFGIALVYVAFSFCLNLIGIRIPCIEAIPAVFWTTFILLVVIVIFQKLTGH